MSLLFYYLQGYIIKDTEDTTNDAQIDLDYNTFLKAFEIEVSIVSFQCLSEYS